MFIRALIVLISLAVLGGCSPTMIKESDIVTIDPESADTVRNGPVTYEPTPDNVIVGESNNISIEVQKRTVVKDEQADGITLQVWDVIATNNNDNDKCVTPMWRLMDFEYISNGPSEQFVQRSSMVKIGEMQQRVWIINGVPVAPPPSGYLTNMRVRDTIAGARVGEECTHIVNEKDIEEQ